MDCLVEKHISNEDCAGALELPPDEFEQFLREFAASVFGIEDKPENSHLFLALTEYLEQLFGFARDMSSPEQATAVISLGVDLHRELMNKRVLTLDQAVAFLTRALQTHAVDRPPVSVALFSTSAVARVAAWFTENYLRVLRLHVYLFVRQDVLDLRAAPPAVVNAPSAALRPLAEAQFAPHAAPLTRAQEHAANAAAAATVLADAAPPVAPDAPDAELEATLGRADPERLAFLVESQVRAQIEELRDGLDARLAELQGGANGA
eukprot:gnl/Chilomastix_cuspidata/1626.p1 GENE.gnl/Chilomastix_cuspidata/1626~~gnl/Chilomastix_cuspidata/1626.p1  ORF type:complete len:264 (-),score=124.87 gnl/Chilomastix_cuspidata/1626:88-879(-)